MCGEAGVIGGCYAQQNREHLAEEGRREEQAFGDEKEVGADLRRVAGDTCPDT